MAAFDYDPHTALVVVDVQNDFADPAGSLYVDGGETVVEPINDEVAAALDAGATVVYTADWHPPRTPHFVDQGGTWPPHCVRDTWGAQFHPDLRVAGPVIRKGTGGEDGYSGFTVADPTTGDETPTGLHDLLSQRGVHHVVVVGLALDVCVKATALDAVALDYGVAVLADATRPVELTPGDGERARAEITEAGAIVVHSSPPG